MKLSDLPDDFTPEQFRQLDKESLDAVPFTRMRWLCQCKGCKNGTHVRDYGIGWYFLDRNSKAAEKNPHDYWMGVRNYWLCGKHNRFFKRMEKIYGFEAVFNKLIDPTKDVLIPMDNQNMETVRRIEEKS